MEKTLTDCRQRSECVQAGVIGHRLDTVLGVNEVNSRRQLRDTSKLTVALEVTSDIIGLHVTNT